jgi:arginyl-tRNA synthetase
VLQTENKSDLATIEQTIQQAVASALEALFYASADPADITINETRKDFEGDVTVVVFPLLRFTKKSPEESARLLGEYLVQHVTEIDHFNVVKGFLNCTLSGAYWQDELQRMTADEKFGFRESGGDKVMVEYSSPNTNKPIHLGHVRNNVLGYAVSGLLKANGHEVIKANLVNDRGIHICKSMLAWQKWGNGETPASSGMKGDHLVGKYYVAFNNAYRQQIAELVNAGMEEKEAERRAPVFLEAQEMLRQWENGSEEIIGLWKMMNSWVYEGFEVTYRNLGVDFDQYYYESKTYLLGRDVVLDGLEKGIFFRKDDGSVWVDLTDDGMDEKILLRSDGTSVYITQDIGTADLKYKDYGMKRSIYVVGNEQEYHFKVLQLICKKMGRPYADGIYHLSYGMVELPGGKLKSREGTTVDADDLIAEMIAAARERTQELGKIEGFTEEEAEHLYRVIALGALKFFLLKVDPRKNMLFIPEESIDLQGYTGPFVQYTHARIRSLLRKSGIDAFTKVPEVAWNSLERELVRSLARFPAVLSQAGEELNPAALVDYAYHLAKQYNKYYTEVTVLGAETEDLKTFRLTLSMLTARTIRSAFEIVGIEAPEQM